MSSLVYTFNYTSVYDPPFPTAEVWLSVPDLPQDEQAVTALLDSGSDGSLIPLDVIESLGAIRTDKVRIRGLFGGSSLVYLYLVNLRVGPHRLHKVEVAAVERRGEALIGRNVLNRFAVLLDGPANAVEIPA